MGAGVVLQFWRGGEPMLRDLDAEDPSGEKEIFPFLSTMVDVPFWHGTLAVNSQKRQAFSDAQIALLEDMAHLLEDGFRRVDDLRALQARNEALEREVAEGSRAEAELEASVAEKEALLKETHHPVRNNLQVVSSLLNLRAQTLEDPEALRSFEDCRAQIRSMALIHERLYDSDDLARPDLGECLDLGEYRRALAENVLSSYGIPDGTVELQVETTPHSVSVDTAIQSGLVVHEQVSNALRCAFPQGPGTVRIEADPGAVRPGRLRIADDGIGLPRDIEPGKGASRSLGLRLAGDLARQMNSTAEVDREGGTAFEITYPLED
jgi:two-component sensor histidine kinase